MKIVYNEETKIFTLPIKVTHDTYNKTSNLVDILKNSDDRKELLKRGYDPSVKPTQRVVDDKVIKDTSESNGNPYVREYLNEDAVRKTSNDKILNDYINERNGTKADDPSNYQGLDESNPNTHIRVIKPGKGFDYHGYKQYPMGGHYFGDVKVGINGLNYTVDQDVKDGNSEVEFDLSTGDVNDQMKIVNRKENIIPLYNSVLDQLNEYKPSSVSYIPADNSNTLDEGNDKRRSNMNDRGHQRNELYKRKIKRFAPDSEVTNEGFLTYIDLNNPDWRKLATKSYSIVYNEKLRNFSVNYLPGFSKNRTLRGEQFLTGDIDFNGGADPEYSAIYLLSLYILGDTECQYDIIKSIDPVIESSIVDAFDDPLVVNNIKPNNLKLKIPEVRSLCSKISTRYSNISKSKITDMESLGSIGDYELSHSDIDGLDSYVYRIGQDIKLIVVSRKDFVNSIK